MSDPNNAQADKVGADRVALLARFNEANGTPTVASEEAPAEAPASSDNAPKSADSAETPVEPPVKDDKSVQKPADKVVEKKDEILVSKKALDEEREKRKAKTLEARTALAERDAERQSRIQLEARIKELEAKVNAAPAKPGVAPAKEDEVAKQLAEENKRLKEENQKAAAKATADEQAKAAEEMQKTVMATGQSLDKEGFPGFTRFTVEVAHALEAKIKAGELDVEDVTPELWAKTYKEDVYPGIKQIFAEQKSKEKLEAKKVAKKEASLVKTPGNAPNAAEEADLDAPQTAESYMKFRKTLK